MLKKKKEQYEERLERVHLMKIIEHTPLGNVLMYYDNNQKTFCYQGPKNIPFKYLETVARKYVKIFNCKPLYVNLNKELETWRLNATAKLTETMGTDEFETEIQKIQDATSFTILKA